MAHRMRYTYTVSDMRQGQSAVMSCTSLLAGLLAVAVVVISVLDALFPASFTCSRVTITPFEGPRASRSLEGRKRTLEVVIIGRLGRSLRVWDAP